MIKLANIQQFQSLTNTEQSSNHSENTQIDHDDVCLFLRQVAEDDLFRKKQIERALRNPYNYKGILPPKTQRKLYIHGKGINIPLKRMVEQARKFMNRPNRLAVTNIRIYQKDFDEGKFDVKFYGQTLPALVKYVRDQCVPKTVSSDTILADIDDENFFVGRSEDNIIDKLSTLATNISPGSLEQIPRKRWIKKHIAPIDAVFHNDISPKNKHEARKWGLYFAKELLSQGASENFIPNILSSFDLFAHLCEYYGVDVDSVLEGVRIDTNPKTGNAGQYNPYRRLISIAKDHLDPETMVHELWHALYHSMDDSVIEDTTPHNQPPDPPEELLYEDFDRWPDRERLIRSGNSYASHMYRDPSVMKLMSEYYTTLLSVYLGGHIPQRRRDIVNRFITLISSMFGKKRITKTWVENFVKSAEAYRKKKQTKNTAKSQTKTPRTRNGTGCFSMPNET